MSLVAVATLIFVGCNKENSINEQAQQDVVLNFNIEPNNGGDNTKAMKTGWENNDKLYLLFCKGYSGVYTPKDYITLTYNSTKAKWNVTGGQNVLNSITKNSGYVHILHCDGTPTENGENITFHNAGETFFLISQSATYSKAGNVITIRDKKEDNTFKLYNGLVQFNVKIPYNKYSKVVMEDFYSYDKNSFTETKDANGYKNIQFTSDGIGTTGNMGGNYPAQKTSDENEMAFFFVPWSWNEIYSTARIRLKITIDEKNYTILKDFSNLDISPNQCYSIKGPTADDNTIKTAAANTDLGNGWYKAQEVTFN